MPHAFINLRKPEVTCSQNVICTQCFLFSICAYCESCFDKVSLKDFTLSGGCSALRLRLMILRHSSLAPVKSVAHVRGLKKKKAVSREGPDVLI